MVMHYYYGHYLKFVVFCGDFRALTLRQEVLCIMQKEVHYPIIAWTESIFRCCLSAAVANKQEKRSSRPTRLLALSLGLKCDFPEKQNRCLRLCGFGRGFWRIF